VARLEPLVRVRRHTLEVQQRALAALLREEEALEAARAQVLAERAAERAAAVADVEALVALARYEAACTARLEAIAADLAALAKRIAKAREAVREAFAEAKKVEIVATRRADAARTAARKAEGQALDEAGLEAYRRREEG
jgi:flagellar export protein FliJ